MLGYLIKNLNSKNISTLYMNGMSEYYNMEKNEFNLMQSSFFIGYLLGGFPSKYLMSKCKIRYYLGFLELMWALLTFSMCFCQNVKQVYLVRFLIGFLELGFFPSLVYIIGSFYNDTEVNKRQLLFNVSGTLGTMITGPLQQFILSRDLNLFHFEKFQILFLLDAIISLPIAFYTLAVNPGVPTLIDVWYFDDEDKEVLRIRLEETIVPVKISHKFTDYFKTWHVIVFPCLFAIIRNASFAAEQIVATSWIKYDLKLPSVYYNYFPSVVNGLAVILTLSVSIVNDKHHGLYTPLLLYTYFVLFFICSSLLVYWKIPVLLHWLCYIVFGSLTWPTPLLFSWLNRTLSGDNERRHFIVVLTNSFDYLIYAIYPVWAWDTRQLPYFKRGFTCTAILAVMGGCLTWITHRLCQRQEKKEVGESTPLLDA